MCIQNYLDFENQTWYNYKLFCCFIADTDGNKNNGDNSAAVKKLTRKNIRKIKRQHGEEYYSAKGKLIKKKQCCLRSCGCIKHCSRLISDTKKQNIFSNYYKLNWAAKKAFVSGQIKLKTCKKLNGRKDGSILRNQTRVYRLPDENGLDQIVCKTFFQDTLDIGSGTISNMLVNRKSVRTLSNENRKKHNPTQ